MSEDLALVSDAGMPSINDPGHELIAAAIDKLRARSADSRGHGGHRGSGSFGASDFPVHLRRVSAEEELRS